MTDSHRIFLFYEEMEHPMDEEIRDGDTVVLLTGGPAMTVGMIYMVEKWTVAKCQWFQGTTLHEAEFPLASLQKVKD